MFEKVNPSHPDKIADRIAGALVDYCYTITDYPRCAFEVLIGHNNCTINGECSVDIPLETVKIIVNRIAGECEINYLVKPQDKILAKNQGVGDNGIFRGVPVSTEEEKLTRFVKTIYKDYPYDGKYIYDREDDTIIVCQSMMTLSEEKNFQLENIATIILNPLGNWEGGINVDTGATNRKLGSDMGRAVTGGGLHGKDLSKADVSVNIYAHLKARKEGRPVELYCAIGDKYVDDLPYTAIVEIAKDYIKAVGGFEKFAEWGLIR